MPWDPDSDFAALVTSENVGDLVRHVTRRLDDFGDLDVQLDEQRGLIQIHHAGAHADVWLWHKESGGIATLHDYATKQQSRKLDLLLPLQCKSSWLGVDRVCVPADAHALMRQEFGSTYMTPLFTHFECFENVWGGRLSGTAYFTLALACAPFLWAAMWLGGCRLLRCVRMCLWSGKCACGACAALLGSPGRRRALLLIALVGIFLFEEEGCNLSGELAILLHGTGAVFDRFGIQYWLDYGTLLGVARDGGIIPWEYDNDVGMMEDQCAAASTPAVRAAFSALGYSLYNMSDRIAAKEHLVYDHQVKEWWKRLKYSDPYLHTPCLRVYDKGHVHFVDVYWFRRITAAQARGAPQGTYNIPPRYDFKHDLLCNNEGLESDEFYPGGCRDTALMLPLAQKESMGRKWPVPRNSVQVCRDNYPSSDAMKVGAPKGFKRLLCFRTWTTAQQAVGFVAFALVVSHSVFGLPGNAAKKKKYASVPQEAQDHAA